MLDTTQVCCSFLGYLRGLFIGIWASLGMFLSVPSWAPAVVSKRHNIIFMLLKTISIFIFFFTGVYLLLKEYCIFKAFSDKMCPTVSCCFTVPLSWACISYFSAFIGAADRRVRGTNQIHFQVSVPKKSVLIWKLECTVAFGTAPLASYAFCLWVFLGNVEGDADSVWFRSVLLALLFISVTSTGIYHFVVFIDLTELTYYVVTFLSFFFTLTLFFHGSK